MIDVSVCIPCYNSAAFVREAIDSALAQTGVTLEVIVVDDGSTDESLQVIQSYGERIQVITQANAGACVARNVALARASGTAIQFLDSDDRIRPGKLEQQFATMEAKGLDLVLCQGMVFGDGKGMRPKGRRLSDPAGMDPLLYALEVGWATHGTLSRRSFIERVGGFNEQLPRGQELDLHLRSGAAHARLGLVDVYLEETRNHDGDRITASPRPPESFMNQLVQLSHRLEEEEIYAFSSERRKAFASYLFNHATHAFRAGAEADARIAMDRCIELHPRFEMRTRRWYALAARWIHPIQLERFLKCGRFVKYWGRR